MAVSTPRTTVISDRTLRTAVERGVISSAQAERLLELGTSSETLGEAASDDEKFRFITGFGDIFVTIGLALFLGALGYFCQGALGLSGMAAVVAAATWGLAEFFTRRRRMALPSIVLLVVFAAMAFLAVYASFAGGSSLFSLLSLRTSLDTEPLAVVGGALAAVVAAAFHYRRFRVPITFAAGTAALVAALLGLAVAIAPGFVQAAWTPLLLLCGVGVFALAMRFDLSDPTRETRRTDIAFWLHMLAAPLIVHPLVGGVISDRLDAGAAWSILAIFAGLGLVAIVVDRRAVLVSGLSYAGIAFGTLVGGNVEAVPLTMLTLGGLVLLLSAGWQTLRRLLLSSLPPAITDRLPPPVSHSARVELPS